MERLFAFIGAVSAFLAVAAGAFGTHSLRQRLPADMLNTFEVGIRYQMYHALGLLGIAWAMTRWSHGAVALAGWLFIIGTILFSGSLYALSLSGVRWLGAITPFGGLAFLIGWLLLAWVIWHS
ncbi:MAG: DUF423 domain-containing protein [Candidatus Latescibacteria bacterium]|nr:DUF423 domain-containing protein [Candidatus Latescibacterota bacterium]